jgi:glycosyltransferase involved in cell wall biosynthesis
MNIAFLSPSVSRAAGGIFEIEKALAHSLSSWPDIGVEVFGLQDQFTNSDAHSWNPVRVNTFEVRGPRSFGFSPDLRRGFLSCAADVAHLHALWTYCSVLIHEWSRKRGRPYVTTLNGMLDPWALNNSFLKKKVAGFLYERRSEAGAGCIQVNSYAELRAARAFGLRNPICVVPNGVALPNLEKRIASAPRHEVEVLKSVGRKILLYLGRLHPKKGLPHLITALHNMGRDCGDWVLVIAGWDQAGHVDDLRTLTASLNLEERIVFIGPQYGAEKDACFRCADAFILPSYSEGLPMAVLEAWAYGKPVLMTPACNLPVGYSAGAAISIASEARSVERGLRQLFEMADEERKEMGRRGRTLATESFSWNSAAEQLRSVYTWLLGGGTVPACIVPYRVGKM